MSHMLLVKKHHRLLLRNVESRPAREVHNIVAIAAHADFGVLAGLVLPVGASEPRGLNQLTIGHHVEAHAVEASKRPT